MYNLDVNREIKIFNLVFHDTYSTLLLAKDKKEYSPRECIEMVEKVINVLESYTSVGFLSTTDLTKFPIVSELLQPFLLSVNPIEVKEYINGNKSMESYKWIYNLIVVSLYIVCLESLQSNLANTLDSEDVIVDLRVKEQELYSRLDPSIRQHIQKRGLSIKQNTYVGFDTEFKFQSGSKSGEGFNTLVSSQLAVTTKSYLTIPRVQVYKLSKLDEDTNKLQVLNTVSTVFNYKKIETSLKMSIAKIRSIKYPQHDKSLYQLSEGFKLVKGINYSEQEEHIVFSLPRTVIQPYIHYGTSFSFKSIIEKASGIASPHHKKINSILTDLIDKIGKSSIVLSEYAGITELEVSVEKTLPVLASSNEKSEVEEFGLEEFGLGEGPESLKELSFDNEEKRLSRQYLTDLFPQKVSVTRTRQYYIIAHLTPADLSMLSDFEEIKEELSIVSGSFVTLGKPIKYYGRNIHIRDTMLLAPGASKSLASIGRLYGEAFHKIEISRNDIEDMHGFLTRDKAKFTEYALRDALISLIHACWMEEFNFSIGIVGIPLSLSSIGRNYVKSIWREESYGGYQISSKYLLGDVSATMTPKGLNVVKDIGFVLPYYIANYKGGRNECFMYGVDRDTEWYDYDLTSAYTTVLSMAGHPDYSNCIRLTISELKSLSRGDKLYSYLIIKADFKFPKDIQYPSIPCYVDENCTVYPLQGTCIITGSEYILASSQKCQFKISEIYYTPFKTSDFKEIKPFKTIVNLVQERRREHSKGTISNMIYKEIGNSIYGSVVRGIGNKRKFDIKSQGTVRMHGDELTNPLIASWTTAFVRSIIGECLHTIQQLGGLVVSVTTDGFITDIRDLEEKLTGCYLLEEYQKIRETLASDKTSLELKNQGKGILAWSTRGQIGIDSKMIATTGLQHRVFRGKGEMVKSLIQTIKSESKSLEYIQSRLRSASDIYKRGGQVIMLRRDQIFRMHYDNRRQLEWETTIPTGIEILVTSKPLEDVMQARNLRFISRLCKQPLYGKYIGVNKSLSRYKNTDEIVVRNFLKCLLSNPPLFNLHRAELQSYQSVVEYIKSYKSSITISSTSLAKIQAKIRNSSYQWLPIKKGKESEQFVLYVQQKFKSFDVVGFYGLLEKVEKSEKSENS